MMKKMGWEEGKGLGKNNDGITEHVKVKKKDDKIGIGKKGYDWGNEWWADSYNSALGSGKKKGKGGKKKKKKKQGSDDSDDSESDSDSDSSDSGSEAEEKEEDGKEEASGILSQKELLFSVGLSAHP